MDLILMMKNELMLVAIIVTLLIMKIADQGKSNNMWIGVINVLLIINCFIDWLPVNEGELFGGVYKSYALGNFGKNLLSTGVLLISLFSVEWLKRCEHIVEFYLLMLSTLLGMFFMISSGNFLIFFLSLELSTIPLAALCNFGMTERKSGEAAMKMIFSSAFSSCLMLMGISFLYGASGTLNFEILTVVVQETPLYIMGFVLLFVGVAFKLSVVPFHLWTADVYEGSPVPVTAFLSVISKGAMIIVFSFLLYHVFGSLYKTWYLLLYVLSIVTMITGNIFAIRQENMKRFLAFSSITQVGYILVGISGSSAEGVTSSIYFIVVYIFSNIAAFGVISQIEEKSGRVTISSYKGLSKQNPFLAWTMAIALFSLAGIPPTAGFFGKIFLLKAGASNGDLFLITIAALNMIIALYYYLRVIRAMFMDESEEPIPKLPSGIPLKFALAICLVGILLTGFSGSVYEYILSLSKGI